MRPPSPKTKFVRELPAKLTINEMIEEARLAGHDVTRRDVDRARRKMGLGFKLERPRRSSIVRESKPQKKKTERKYIKKTTAVEALAEIRAAKKTLNGHANGSVDLTTAVRRLAIRHGSGKLREVLDALEND